MRCPVCQSEKLKTEEIRTQEAARGAKRTIFACEGCGVLFDSGYRLDRSALYEGDYAAWGNLSDAEEQLVAESKKSAFQEQLEVLEKKVGLKGKKLLDIGTAHGYLLEVAAEKGMEVFGTEISQGAWKKAEAKFPGRVFLGPLEELHLESRAFDVVVMTDVLEHLNDPRKTIREIGRILKPGGWLMLISPNSGSWTRKLWGKDWFQYKYEHIFFFGRRSLERLLRSEGFLLEYFANNRKSFSLAYYAAYFRKYSFGFLGWLFLWAYPWFPDRLKKTRFSNPITGEFLALARKK